MDRCIACGHEMPARAPNGEHRCRLVDQAALPLDSDTSLLTWVFETEARQADGHPYRIVWHTMMHHYECELPYSQGVQNAFDRDLNRDEVRLIAYGGAAEEYVYHVEERGGQEEPHVHGPRFSIGEAERPAKVVENKAVAKGSAERWSPGEKGLFRCSMCGRMIRQQRPILGFGPYEVEVAAADFRWLDAVTGLLTWTLETTEARGEEGQPYRFVYHAAISGACGSLTSFERLDEGWGRVLTPDELRRLIDDREIVGERFLAYTDACASFQNDGTTRENPPTTHYVTVTPLDAADGGDVA